MVDAIKYDLTITAIRLRTFNTVLVITPFVHGYTVKVSSSFSDECE